MESCPLHPWDLSPAEAGSLQEELRRWRVAGDRLGLLRTVTGVDVAFDRTGTTGWAAVAVLTFPGLEPVEEAVASRPVTFPYLPGLLAFREVPAALAALARLRHLPDLLLCDGQGLAHPRRFGLACHLGVLAGLPSIGIAKTWLLGEHEPPPPGRGAWQPLREGGEIVGAALRTRSGVRPVYVSAGHRVSLETSVRLTLATAPRFRLPEPLRHAHRRASAAAAVRATT